MFPWPGYEPIDIGTGMAGRVDWEFEDSAWPEFDGDPGIEQANFLVNQDIEYVPDIGDYWQSPDETWARKTGDCEDFCIGKYALLKRIGEGAYTDMAMVVGQDVMNAHDGKREVHALLFVSKTIREAENEKWAFRIGQTVVLDNRTPLIKPDTEYHKFFTPMYAVDEEKTWFYKKVVG